MFNTRYFTVRMGKLQRAVPPEGDVPMPKKLDIFFLGLSVGGATFLVAGFAFSLMIAQLQYMTLEAQVAQAVAQANQVSIRAKDTPVMVSAERYELVSNTP
jgi:hypothetical protein